MSQSPTIGGSAAECACEALTSDGHVIRIRPIRPDDAAALVEFHESLSSETVHRRFFSAHPHLRPSEVEHFTTVDYRDRLALVAEAGGRMAAVGRYDREDGTDQAEVAFVVADSWQSHGLGMLLLEHLAAAARRRGVSGFKAQTLGTNYSMLNVFRHSGFECSQQWVDGVFDVSFPIAPTDRYLEAVSERFILAAHASPAIAEQVRRAERPRQRGVAVVACGAGGPAAVDALAYLSAEPSVEVIVLDLRSLRRPRRLVALARTVTQRKPVLALLPPTDSGALPFGGDRLVSLHDVRWILGQAGIEVATEAGWHHSRARRLESERHAGTWKPAPPGHRVDLDRCDPAAARAVLDRCPGPDGTDPAGTLEATEADELLADYGLPLGRPDPDVATDVALIVADDPFVRSVTLG